MNVNDIERVNQLTREKQAIDSAVELLGQGGRITAMTISRPPPAGGAISPFIGGVAVPTGYIVYPPQMVESIRAAFTTRRQAIDAELARLGVTS